MADLRIVDAPVLLKESITGDVKMPTGGLGNYAIRLGDLVWYVVAKEQLASKNYVDLSSKGVKDSLDEHIADKANPHDVTKAQVGLGNVDNTADIDKPVSNATKSAIITATTDMATKAYVNQQDNLKADKATTLGGYGIADAYTKDETYNRTEVDDALLLKASVAYVDSKDGDLTTLKTTDKIDLVKAINEVFDNTKGVVSLYSKNTEVGAGEYGWDDSLVLTQYNRTLRDKLTDFSVSIKDFGAKGNDNQTLYATDYYSDLDKGTRITQQTADGIGINMAIKWLRNKGGGSLYIPPCDAGKSYRVYGYLEPIDFPCVIYGAGANSLIKNCDNSPTNTHGYGIFCVQPENYEEILFLNFKVDGNAEVRTKPTSEFRAYPLALYGKPKFKMFGITSVNSPIDCFMTSYIDNDPDTYVKTVNCHFDNSYRNTVSLVSGWNQYHVNMTVDRGGYVHGGTQPRYGIDIEPNVVGRSIENIHFTNCHFKRAINVCVGGVWAQAKFDNCTFDGSIAHPTKELDKTYPWVFQLTEGKWQLNNCRFVGRDDYMQNASHHFNSYNVNSKFNDSQYLKLHHCVWEKSGFISTSRSVELLGCSAQNSLHPFVFSGGATTSNNDVFIRNLNLKNVFDDGNYGTGTESSFAITNSVGGKIDVDGVTVEIDAASLKSIPKELFTKTRYYGVSISTSKSTAAGKRTFIRNIHSEGFYKRLVAYLERAVNSGNMRDWNFPAMPPENTIKLTSAVTATLTDGTVANNAVTNKAVTGSATENSAASARTLGDKGAVYQNCTMWGNYD